MSDQLPPPYSKTKRAGSLIFTSGHVARRPDGTLAEGIVDQTEQVLNNLETSLREHGLDRRHIVRTTVYLSDYSMWADMNEPFRRFFEDAFPTRSAVGVELPAGMLVEIDAVAYDPGDGGGAANLAAGGGA